MDIKQRRDMLLGIFVVNIALVIIKLVNNVVLINNNNTLSVVLDNILIVLITGLMVASIVITKIHFRHIELIKLKDKKKNKNEKQVAKKRLREIVNLYEKQEYEELYKIVENRNSVSEFINYCDCSCLNEILNTYREKCENMKIEFEIEIDISIRNEVKSTNENIGLTVKKLNSLVGNLIDNSIDELNISGISEKKILFRLKDEYGSIKYIITNNGRPIKKKHMDNIFSQGYSTKSKNRGVGLYVISIIAAELNAVIEVDSNKEYTRFTVSIERGVKFEDKKYCSYTP